MMASQGNKRDQENRRDQESKKDSRTDPWRPINETYKRDLHRRPTHETYTRDLQKRLENRSMETYRQGLVRGKGGWSEIRGKSDALVQTSGVRFSVSVCLGVSKQGSKERQCLMGRGFAFVPRSVT